jgi:hypothetical protein
VVKPESSEWDQYFIAAEIEVLSKANLCGAGRYLRQYLKASSGIGSSLPLRAWCLATYISMALTDFRGSQSISMLGV